MHGDCGIILRTFCKSFHVRLLEIETSPKKIRGVEKESFTFEQNVTNELAFDFKTFCVCKKLVLFFNAKVWLIFGSLLLIIIFFHLYLSLKHMK